MRCRCGHELPIRNLSEQAHVRCIYCGRSYRLSRDPQGKLKASALGDSEQQPAEAAQSSEWPEDLELELEQPVRPERTIRQAAAAPAPAQEAPEAGIAGAALEPADRRSWWYYLADAWTYPLRGSAKWTLLLLWLVVNVFVAPFFFFLFPIGIIVAFAMFAVLCLYEFALIRQSSWDAGAIPSLPKWEDWYESAFRPLGQLLAVIIGSGIPFYIVALPDLFLDMPPWWAHVMIAGLALSGLMVPMNMLAVATADSAAAINPKFTFPAVMKVPVPYIVCSVFCAFCYWAGIRTQDTLLDLAGGGFLGAFVGRGAWLYFITVAARALGTLHYAYSDKMGWMK